MLASCAQRVGQWQITSGPARYNSRRSRCAAFDAHRQHEQARTAPMRILLSNDDGYFAPGLEHLAAALAPHAEHHGRRARARPQRRVQFADARPAAVGAPRAERLPVRQRHADRLRSSCGDRTARRAARHGDLRDQSRREHGRRHDLLGHRRRGDRRLSARRSVGRDIARVEDRRAFRNGRRRGTRIARAASARSRRGRGCSTSTCPTSSASRVRGYRITRLGRRHKAEDVVAHAKPARRDRVLGRRRGRCGRCGRGHRFPCGREPLRSRSRRCRSTSPIASRCAASSRAWLATADARDRDDRRWQRSVQAGSGTSGIGMTSDRTRARMVERLRAEGIRDEVVLSAMNAIPRHIFVDEALAIRAYDDAPLPIGSGQTISQPWVVARMTELARNGRDARRRARDRHRLRLPDGGARAARENGLHGRAHRRARQQGAAPPAVARRSATCASRTATAAPISAKTLAVDAIIVTAGATHVPTRAAASI